MKQFQNLQSQKPATGAAEFFNLFAQGQGKLHVIKENITLGLMQECLERLSYQSAKDTMSQFFNCIMNQGHSLNKTWNELMQVSLINMSKTFGYASIFRLAHSELISNFPKILDQQALDSCTRLLKCFGAFMLLENQAALLAYGILDVKANYLYHYIDGTVGDYSEFINDITQFTNNRSQQFMDVQLQDLDFNKLSKL